MKLFCIFLILVVSTIAKDTHYHYHMENLSPALKKMARRELAIAKYKKHMGVKNWFCGVGCFFKNMFNSKDKEACKAKCDADEKAKDSPSPAPAPAKH